ncbi:MAG: hypothetical protein ACFCUO_03375 [Rhodospirillales bacterium]
MRYWKRCLSPLRKKDGRSQTYTFAEVVAMAVIADAVAAFNVGVERLAPLADEFFELVANAVEPGREPGMICFGPASVAWLAVPPPDIDACMLILPLGAVVARIRSQIATVDAPVMPPAQYELPLPGRKVVGLRPKP